MSGRAAFKVLIQKNSEKSPDDVAGGWTQLSPAAHESVFYFIFLFFMFGFDGVRNKRCFISVCEKVPMRVYLAQCMKVDTSDYRLKLG